MADLIQTTRQEGVGVIALAHPPVNSLGQPLRRALMAAFADLEADQSIHAIVLAAGGRGFAAGADLRDLDGPEAQPRLAEICARIEASVKPVVAALHGPTLGPGLELALAAHYRIALASAQFGFPEITLEMMPGSGGTQRAAHLIGAAAALRLLLTGQPIPAAEAAALGLVDRVVDKDVAVQAYLMARSRPEPRPTLGQTRWTAEPLAYEAAIAQARRQQLADSEPQPAPGIAAGRIIDAVEAALLLAPPAALDFEQAAAADCLAHEASVGLRHAFIAERRLARFPDPAAKPRALHSVGIVGAGKIGAGLALALIGAGLRCVVVERDRDQLVKALETIASAQEAQVEAGALSAEARDADWARIGGSVDLAALEPMDMVIEALPEQLALKAQVLEQLATLLRPGTVIGTTTEALDLTRLAEATGRPQDVIGFHLSLPLPSAQLIEIGAARTSVADAAATGFALAQKLRRAAVLVRTAGAADEADLTRTGGGLVAARLAAACWQSGKALARRGVTPQDVAAALAALGQQTAPATQPRKGSDVSQEELQRRCLGAMINEAARILSAKMVARPSDIDMVSILGLGMPRWRGGLMQMADSRGILALRLDLAEFAADDPALWAPHPMILEMFKNGTRFSDLNG